MWWSSREAQVWFVVRRHKIRRTTAMLEALSNPITK